MSFELIATIHLRAVKCPECGEPIERTKDYIADIVRIDQIGGEPIPFVRGEEVTLVCESCGWEKRTDNWRRFLK